MTEPLSRHWRRIGRSELFLKLAALGTALVAVAVFGYLGHLRPPGSHIWGDEGTYLAMTASLARDGDLIFAEPDRDWAVERGHEKGVAVILERADEHITYSKPILYPLLAALPYKLLGERGLVLVNALALAAGLFLVWVALRRLGSGGHLWLTWTVFAGCAALVPYVVWRMSESLQVGLSMAGLTLALGGLARHRTEEGAGGAGAPSGRFAGLLTHPLAPWIGGALLGLLISMRSTNAILAGGAIVACLLAEGWRRAARVSGGVAAAVLLTLLATVVALGTANPYLAERSSFNAEIGYPVGPDHPAAERFDERPATHYARLEISELTLWSAYYFLVGRHTGLLVYFPFALVLAWCLLRRPDRVALSMLAAVVALAAFYLVYMPQNYFGGATFLGNRYFLIAYPALVLGLRRLPPPTWLLGCVAVALLFGGSAVYSVRQARGLDATSQSHTAAGLFRRLPYESTAREIEGQKGRFWSRDYVRFTNAFADVERRRFILHEERPRAEIMIASRLPRPRMVFLVRIGRERGVVDWRDWARSGIVPLEGNMRRDQGLVDFRPATAWRSHQFAFKNDETYQVRVFQLAVHPIKPERRPGREPIEAEVYYLGSDDSVLYSSSWRVLRRRLPKRGVAGRQAEVRLRLRNSSQSTWQKDGVLPVLVGVKFHRDPEAETLVQRFELPHDVRRGEVLDLELDVDLPEEPGRYRVEVDLALHPIYWFSERRGRSIGSRPIEIVAPRGPRGR